MVEEEKSGKMEEMKVEKERNEERVDSRTREEGRMMKREEANLANNKKKENKRVDSGKYKNAIDVALEVKERIREGRRRSSMKRGEKKKEER